MFKDLGLIGWSVLVSGAVVTSLQYFGYMIALIGVTAYSAYKRAQQQEAASSKELMPVATSRGGKGTAEEQETLSAPLKTEEDEESR